MLSAQQKAAALGWRCDTPTQHFGEFSNLRASSLRRCPSLCPALSARMAEGGRGAPRRLVRVAVAAATGAGHRANEEVTEEEVEQQQLQQEREAPAAEREAEEVGTAAAAIVPETEAAAQVAAAGGAAAETEAAVMPVETDAVVVSGQQQGQLVSEEVEEVVERIIEPLTFQSAATRSQAFLTTTLPGKLLVGGVVATFLGSLALATYRAWQKSNTAQAKRMRQIDRNRDLVEGLNKYLLAGNRAGLTPGVLRKLQRSSGFSAVEVFRKYLWYLLRERKFDQGAVEDLVVMKTGLGLTDADVGEALRERATRIYDKYGTLMLNTEGLTLAGAQRKAACTALFRKVLYLAECERLVGPAANEPGGSGAGSVADIGKIFGATVDDMERLRIRNLYEAELDLEGMMAESTDDDLPAAAAGGRGPDGKK